MLVIKRRNGSMRKGVGYKKGGALGSLQVDVQHSRCVVSDQTERVCLYLCVCVCVDTTCIRGDDGRTREHAVHTAVESIEWKDHFWSSGKAPFFLLYMTFSFPPLLCRHLLCICIDQLRTWQHSIVSRYTFIISDLQITLSLLSILQFFYSTWSNPPPPSLFHYTDRHSQHTHRHTHTHQRLCGLNRKARSSSTNRSDKICGCFFSFLLWPCPDLPSDDTHIHTHFFSLFLSQAVHYRTRENKTNMKKRTCRK